MIKISKHPKPQILVENAEKWTNEYCECLNNGIKPSADLAKKYNNPIIKGILEKETSGKCVYCESKIKHISPGDIEHILPKNKEARPDLYVEWDNLTLACEICNRSGKGTYYNPELSLINPYDDEPKDMLQDIGALIMPVLENVRAEITVKILKLNRPALIEKRNEKIEHIEILVQTWAKEINPDMKTVLLQELLNQTTADKEFSSTVKAFLISRGVLN